MDMVKEIRALRTDYDLPSPDENALPDLESSAYRAFFTKINYLPQREEVSVSLVCREDLEF
jgi:hypothetical protein